MIRLTRGRWHHCSLRRRVVLAVFLVGLTFLWLNSGEFLSRLYRSNNLSTNTGSEPKLFRMMRNNLRMGPPRPINMTQLDDVKIFHNVGLENREFENCNGVRFVPPFPPEVLKETFRWQMAEANDKSCYVFSAFYEPRTVPPAVRIIGIEETLHTGPRRYCQLWYADDQMPKVVPAEVELLPEAHDRKYSGMFFVCFLPKYNLIPYAVSLVKASCQTSNNILRIRNNHFEKNYDLNFTVCVTPLNLRFDDHSQLVEILEVNRLFGAEKFVFYNYSMGPQVEKYLKSYEKEGVAQIVPWDLPVAVDVWPPDPNVVPEIHYFAQVIAINDCLYRNMFRSRFVVFTDLDEVIVPRSQDTWMPMLEEITTDWQNNLVSLNGRNVFPGAYLVRNTFFRLDWEDVDGKEDMVQLHGLKFWTLKKLRRESEIFPWFSRSKYMVWSKMAEMVSIHSVTMFIDDYKIVQVLARDRHSLLHHYRRWDDEGSSASHRAVTDDRMLYFAKEIISRVLHRHKIVETA